MRKSFLIAAACVAACSGDAPSPATEDSAIEMLADEYLAAITERFPEMGTYYSIEGASHDRLTDNSLDALKQWQSREDDWLARLNAIDAPTDVGSRDWVTYGIMHEQLESTVQTRICRSELWDASTTTAWSSSNPPRCTARGARRWGSSSSR